MTVINENELQALGVKKNSIFPLALTVNTVTKKSIDLIGGIFLKFSAYDAKSSSTRTSRPIDLTYDILKLGSTIQYLKLN